jgi:hypothetical protein
MGDGRIEQAGRWGSWKVTNLSQPQGPYSELGCEGVFRIEIPVGKIDEEDEGEDGASELDDDEEQVEPETKEKHLDLPHRRDILEVHPLPLCQAGPELVPHRHLSLIIDEILETMLRSQTYQFLLRGGLSQILGRASQILGRAFF